ncbi:MAG: YdcF family protein [Lachnospiraceae bacterium]|nr:YdcF family protein [Lachnospiraceae bacterium]MCI7190754.1 YdcF family protein [Lachnospiraceae bacterium]MDD7627134.1 YdcF family protein [Lachnospiraceae bacterium]MDY4118424.1 YdcF family protein [Lachnospiraceae bacterium]
MYVVLFLVGIAFLIYFLCVAFFVGHGTNFYFIWLILAVVVMTFAILLKRGFFISHFPLWIRRTFVILLCMGVMIFGIVEGFIISGFSMKGQPGADYVIVLGAQMKADGPSKALQYRLDEAIRYLNENPSSKVIVSGGQGSDEHISEAQGMYEYLVEKGIEKDRIIKEDKSVNTTQNLAFSAEYLDRERDSVAVVTNNFHVFRAVKIAEKAGYQNVCGIAAKGEPFLQINNMMREFFGVMKDFLFGNM